MKQRYISGLLQAVLFAGCSHTYVDQAKPEAWESATVMVDDVPFVAQADDDCGPAVLAMLASFEGPPVDKERVAPMLMTPGKGGTLPIDMIGAARRLGFVVQLVNGVDALKESLARSKPVAVLLKLSSSLWHYAVVVGYSGDFDPVFLRSGKTAKASLPRDKFLAAWSQAEFWGMRIQSNNIQTTKEEGTIHGSDN